MLSASDLDRFRAGDPEAVRLVYEQYGRLVFAVSSRILGSPALAEEATQQTFVKAWRSAATFDAARALGPWLATIARTTAIDLHRAEARRSTVSLGELPTDRRELAVSDADATEIDVWAVRTAIDALPDEERTVVRLTHLDGLTHAEAADVLGVPVGTVKSRSFRAHRRLSAALAHLRDGGEQS